MYAVVETGGKQYRVSPGASIKVDLIKTPEGVIIADGEKIELERVLMVANDDQGYSIGAPLVANAKIIARVVSGLEKDSKIIVFKKKRRQGYKKTIGHRAQHTRLLIESISS